MTGPSLIARLKIVLDGVEPVVMRRIEIPADLSLHDLHDVLQIALGWTDSHLYEFRIKDTRFGIPFPDMDAGDAPRDADKTILAQALKDTRAKSFKYLYDFGDGWKHSIKIEGIRPAAQEGTYPRLVEATGRCPPEDIGGPWGYMDFLDVIADPEDEGHEEMLEWLGEDTFDPNLVDTDAIDHTLADFARYWSKKTRRKA